MNITIIEQAASGAEENRVDRSLSLGAMVMVVAWAVLW